jgi:hypothetical protein
LAGVEDGGFLERRGREGFAKSAKEDKEKIKPKRINFEDTMIVNFKSIDFYFFFIHFFPFVFSFLRSLRNLCALCVQKIPS